jgi:hypothetical protein
MIMGEGRKFIGVKVVEAAEMNLGDYNDFRGWAIPPDEDPATEGYLVIYKDGYKSWCPKAQFKEANRPIEGMTFGHAIEAAKQGSRIARAGWNGKGMFVVYQRGYPEGIPCNAQTAEAFGYELGELFRCRPYLQMRCADGTHQMWLASQSDILEEDWMIV